MSYRLLTIFFSIWIFLLISLIFVYKKSTPTDINALEREIRKLSQYKDSQEIFDQFSSLFDKDISLLALILTDSKGYVKGSMFEPGRFTAEEYNNLLRNFSNIKSKSHWKNHKLIKFDIQSQNNHAYLLMKTEKNLTDSFFIAVRSVPLLRYLTFSAVLWSVFVFLSYMYFFLRNEKIKHPSNNTDFIKNKTFSTKKSQIQNNDAGLIDSFKYLNEKQLLNFIDLLSKKYFCPKTAFFSREKNRWLPVLQKRGEIYVKGESIKIPDFLEEFGEPENWNTPILRESGSEYYLPVMHKEILTGVFWCKFSNMNIPEIHMIHDMQETVSSFARSVFVQKVYEKAVIDEETGFYNYPYFYFLLKERIQFEKNIAAIIFKIEPFLENISGINEWGRKIYSILDKKRDSKTVICRLEQGKFIALFNVSNLSKSEQHLEYEFYKSVAAQIRESVYEAFSSHTAVYGAVVPKEKVKGSVDSFLSTLELALKIAVENKTMGYIMSEIGGGIL
ncbi:MAG: hypothetical protein OEZ13_00465 [Spirochaetia bacterium]|nr:hypothetical protein [Spirochaetia bacterium]